MLEKLEMLEKLDLDLNSKNVYLDLDLAKNMHLDLDSDKKVRSISRLRKKLDLYPDSEKTI